MSKRRRSHEQPEPISADGTAIWIGANGQKWITPETVEIRSQTIATVEPVPGTGPYVVLAAATEEGWCQIALPMTVAANLVESMLTVIEHQFATEVESPVPF